MHVVRCTGRSGVHRGSEVHTGGVRCTGGSEVHKASPPLPIDSSHVHTFVRLHALDGCFVSAFTRPERLDVGGLVSP